MDLQTPAALKHATTDGQLQFWNELQAQVWNKANQKIQTIAVFFDSLNVERVANNIFIVNGAITD
jgi:hypothetical protein